MVCSVPSAGSCQGRHSWRLALSSSGSYLVPHTRLLLISKLSHWARLTGLGARVMLRHCLIHPRSGPPFVSGPFDASCLPLRSLWDPAYSFFSMTIKAWNVWSSQGAGLEPGSRSRAVISWAPISWAPNANRPISSRRSAYQGVIGLANAGVWVSSGVWLPDFQSWFLSFLSWGILCDLLNLKTQFPHLWNRVYLSTFLLGSWWGQWENPSEAYSVVAGRKLLP